MYRLIFSLFLILHLISCEHSNDKIIQKYRQQIPTLMKEHNVTGLAIAVFNKDEIIWAEGFGQTGLNNTAVTADTPFSIQSTSKTITTVAVLMAVQEGLLDLNKTISYYLPNFTLNSRFESHPEQKITLKHLLSHTAGFTHEAPIGNNFDPSSPSFKKHIESISSTWLRYPVGERFSYSNLGIDLAAYILEVVTKKPFASYVKEKILTPLIMTNSSFDLDLIKKRNDRAIGHDKGFKSVPVDIPMMGAGGAYTSANDLAKFVQFHLKGGQGLLNKKLLSKMYTIPFPVTEQTEGYALGIGIAKSENGLPYFHHGGGGFGFLSDMIWYPEQNLGIVLLTNSSDHPLQTTLAQEIINRFIDENNSSHVTYIPEDSNTKNPLFIGSYIGRSSKLEIINENSNLVMILNKERLPLKFISKNEILAIREKKPMIFRLVTPSQGGASRRYLVNIKNGATWDYNDAPREDPGPDRKEWNKYLGSYSINIWGKKAGVTKVHKKNGYLYIDELKTHQHRPGIFFTTTGEALIFSKKKISFMNIPLE